MGNLRKNISRHELACHCECGFDSMDGETLDIVQDCCDHFAEFTGTDKVTCIINSAARCPVHNMAVGGSANSYHPQARAIDFFIVGISPITVYTYLDTRYPDRYGVGLYNTFVHLDTRTQGPARWRG
jgi:uncharacterized protein YcbK (DUF882 family)